MFETATLIVSINFNVRYRKRDR